MADYKDVDFTAINYLGDPNQALGLGALGVGAALVFANLGAAFGTAKSGCAIVEIAAERPELIFRSIIPVVMAGILGMYGMIIAIIMKGSSKCKRNNSAFLRPLLPNLKKIDADQRVVFSDSERDGAQRFWQPFELEVQLVHWLHASGRRTFRWIFSSRLRASDRCKWCCWRSWHQAHRHPYRSNSHDDLCRGYRPLRLHCCNRARLLKLNNIATTSRT